MYSKKYRVVIAFLLVLGLVFSTASMGNAAPKVKQLVSAEILNVTGGQDGGIEIQYSWTNVTDQNSIFYYKIEKERAAVMDYTTTVAVASYNSGLQTLAIPNLSNGTYKITAQLIKADKIITKAIDTFRFEGIVVPTSYTATFSEANDLEGVSVQVYSDANFTTTVGAIISTNASGDAITSLPNGNYYFKATMTAYDDFNSSIPLTINNADNIFGFEMIPVNHTVTFQEYNNLAGVTIQFYSDGTYTTPTAIGGITDTSGSAIFYDMLHEDYWWKATLDGYQDCSETFSLTGDMNCNFEMIPNTTVPALHTVTFAETTSMKGVNIQILSYNDYTVYHSITTDENGVASIILPDDDYWFTLLAAGYYYAPGSGEDSLILSGADSLFEFTMTDIGIDYTVAVAEANSLAGVDIQIFSYENEYTASLTTDSSGEAVIDLPAGNYRIGANIAGFDTYVNDFTIVSDPITLNFTMVSTAAKTMPYYENFSDDLYQAFPLGWSTTHPLNWIITNMNNAGGIYPELELIWCPISEDTFMAITPAIDASASTGLQLTFKEEVDWWQSPFTMQVKVSTDWGVTWDYPVWSITPTGNVGPELVTIDLSAYDGQTIKIAWVLDGINYNIDGWYIDDISVTDDNTPI